MNQERLLSALHSSPLWLSDGLVPRDRCADTPIKGLDITWYWRTFGRNIERTFTVSDCVADYNENVATSYRSPSLAFDEFWYRHAYPDVNELVTAGRYHSGWEHYLREGARRNYNPLPWFDERWYQKQYIEAAVGVRNRELVSGFEHYLLYGIREDYSPSIYFNVAWYRERYMKEPPGGRRSCPIAHYLMSDPAKRPCPVPFFDARWYADRYFTPMRASVDDLGLPTAYEHYLLFGRALGYSPSPYFDEMTYRERYPEVVDYIQAGLYASGFEHYAIQGPINGFLPATHLVSNGIDYSGPEFLKNYERSLLLNLSQLRRICELAEL